MINFENNDSPFFLANKEFCESVEQQLKKLNIDCSGSCNSYGYEIESSFKQEQLSFWIKFHKHRSTQNGVVIAADAINYAGVEIIVNVIDQSKSIQVGKSPLWRFFMNAQLKDKVAAPNYIKTSGISDSNKTLHIYDEILNSHISKFSLKNGKLSCTIHQATSDVTSLLASIQNIIKTL